MRPAKLDRTIIIPAILSVLMLAVAILGMVLVSRAHAAEAAVSKEGPLVTPQKLTIAECQTILSGLTGLDGRTELSRDGAAVTLAYKFENARLRVAIQQNIAALQAVQAEFSKGVQGVFKEIAGDAPEIKPGTPEMVRYTKQVTDAQQLPCRAELVRIKADDLKLDKNEIPGSVLGALDKILDK